MPTKLDTFNKIQLKTGLDDIRQGNTVSVYQKVPASADSASVATSAKGAATAGKKEVERIQVFQGLVIARNHGKGINATITVRKVISGIGVEKIFPLNSPTIEKIEVGKKEKVRRAKLYYLRGAKGKRARLKEDFGKEEAQPENIEAKPEEAKA